MEFDHLGIATEAATEYAKLFSSLLEAEIVHSEQFNGIEIVFLDIGNGYLELLEPVDNEGVIGSYLEKHGPGIHHIALSTNDIDAALTSAQQLGIDLIDEEPREGAWNHDVAFLHPASTGSVLIEFVEE